MDSTLFSGVLLNLAAAAPAWIVMFVGLVLALVFMGRCPKASILTILAMLLLALLKIYFAMMPAIIALGQRRGWTGDATAAFFTFSNIATNIVQAIALAMLLAAVFSGRSESPKYPLPLGADQRLDAGAADKGIPGDKGTHFG